MNRSQARKFRHYRIRSKIKGTKFKPRVCVFKSLKHIYIQFINDKAQKVLFGVSDLTFKNKDKSLSQLKKAEIIAKKAAEKAKKLGILTIVFDRSGYAYKGIVKLIAETLRKEGLKF